MSRSLKAKPNLKLYVCPFLHVLSSIIVEVLYYSPNIKSSTSFSHVETSTEQSSQSKLSRAAQMSNLCTAAPNLAAVSISTGTFGVQSK